MTQDQGQIDHERHPADDVGPGANVGGNVPKVARRDDLFEPGRYFSAPSLLLADESLSAASKLVWMALAGHLGPTSGRQVWPSESRLSRLTSQSVRTVKRSIVDLIATGWLARDKSPGRWNVYRILQPEAGGKSPTGNRTNRGHNGTSDKLALVTNCPATSAKLAPDWCQNGPPITPGSTELNTHTAFAAANGACVPAAPARITTPEAALAHVEAAMRAGVGRGLGLLERGKVKREFSEGGGEELIASIDAAVVAGAVAATPTNRKFGWGWLVNHAQAQLVKAAVHRRAEAGRQAAASMPVRPRPKSANELEVEAAREYWRMLPQQRQAEYLAAARTCRTAGPKGEGFVESAGVLLAWKERGIQA